MKSDVLQRVNVIIQTNNETTNSFSIRIGVKPVTFSQQIKGDRSLSLDTVLSVLSSFEDISAEWLLRGTGGMYLPASVHPSDAASSSDCSSRLAAMAARLEEKDRQIEMLKELLMRR